MNRDELDHWLDQGFRVLRNTVGVVIEYSPLIPESESPAGWAMADLRGMAHDLLGVMMDAEEEKALSLIDDIILLTVEVIRLVQNGSRQ